MPRPARERDVDADDEDVVVEEKVVDEKKGGLLDDTDLDDEDDGPDNAEARRQQARDERRKAARARDEDEEDERLGHGDEDEEDDERPSRRKRRNRARRDRDRRNQQIIEQMAQEIQSLKGVVSKVTTDQVHLAAGDIDGHIRYTQGQLEEIDAAISRAVTESNGELHAKALRLRDEANRRLDQLVYDKRRLAASVDPRAVPQAPQQTQQPTQPIRQADPAAEKYADDFRDDFPSFDANGTDQFSLAVRAIDVAVDLEGKYKPNQRAYWNEIRRRMKNQNLRDPAGDDDVEDDVEDDYEAPATKRRSDVMPPRAGRAGGGRGPGSTSYRLSIQERETLDEMNLLETKGLSEDQLKYRNRLVKQWKAGFEAAKRKNG
jgi:hypothetical protein